MKKTLFIILLVAAKFMNLSAQEVSFAEAERVAKNFFYERNTLSESIQYYNPVISNSFLIKKEDATIYYAFNFEPTGFVIVSGYKNALPVPAYSLQSIYSEMNQPPQFSAWMKQYLDQIVFAKENLTEPLSKSMAEWKRLLTEDPLELLNLKDQKEVAPMLNSTWDQGIYYNQMCPADPLGPAGHCVTGCVATTLGQLCYYFRWPDSGTGSYTYELPNYGTISANFEDSEYDWNQMTNSATGQNEEIAELLFHLGVSVDMDYGPTGSGMWNHKAAYSLRTFFKYSPETQYLYRDSTNLDWDSVIVSHIDRKIPMYYAGWSVPNINGHAFVVDGYQTEDYFHFNWGWGGSMDGYFYLDNLIPGGNNFNLAQELVINAIPDTLNYTYPSYCSEAKTLTSLKGTLEDGSGPLNNYLGNSACSWLITTQTQEDSVTSIVLNFNRFETEENHDILTIYDGETTASPILGQFSGSSIPASMNSTGNKVLIIFESDETNTAPGWFLSYSSVIPQWCSGITQINTPSGIVSDGSGDFNYHNSSTCMWLIQPEDATESTIFFTEFDTEEQTDVVKVYDAESQILLATYSGTYAPGNLPAPVTSASGKLFISFSTNMTDTRSGWSGYYTSDGVNINENSLLNRDIKIYPNPADDYLKIELNLNEKQNVEMGIFDMKGRLILHKNIGFSGSKQIEKIDFTDFEEGVYNIRIISNEVLFIQKMVKVN
jgi:hypothetical protein